jgi:hypothetical protein
MSLLEISTDDVDVLGERFGGEDWDEGRHWDLVVWLLF